MRSGIVAFAAELPPLLIAYLSACYFSMAIGMTVDTIAILQQDMVYVGRYWNPVDGKLLLWFEAFVCTWFIFHIAQMGFDLVELCFVKHMMLCQHSEQ